MENLPATIIKAVCNTKKLIKITLVLVIAQTAATAQADDHKRERRREREPNWIIERQRAYQVQGVPTERLIIGRRQIDIYPNGLMFAKDHVVGIKPH